MTAAHELYSQGVLRQLRPAPRRDEFPDFGFYKQSVLEEEHVKRLRYQGASQVYDVQASYYNPVKPLLHVTPITYAQAANPYQYREPNIIKPPPLGSMRPQTARNQQAGKFQCSTAKEHGSQTMDKSASQQKAASPTGYPYSTDSTRPSHVQAALRSTTETLPSLTDTAAGLCIYFTSRGTTATSFLRIFLKLHTVSWRSYGIALSASESLVHWVR